MVDLLLRVTDVLFVILEGLYEGLDAFLAELEALIQTVLLISFGNIVGELGRLFRIFAEDANLNQAGIADRPEIDLLFKHGHGFGGRKLLAGVVTLAPFYIQLRLRNDIAKNDLGLDDLEFG